MTWLVLRMPTLIIWHNFWSSLVDQVHGNQHISLRIMQDCKLTLNSMFACTMQFHVNQVSEGVHTSQGLSSPIAWTMLCARPTQAESHDPATVWKLLHSSNMGLQSFSSMDTVTCMPHTDRALQPSYCINAIVHVSLGPTTYLLHEQLYARPAQAYNPSAMQIMSHTHSISMTLWVT